MRGVTGVERDRQELVVRRDQPVRRALQQDAAAQPRRRLTCRGGDQPVEVEPREVQARRERSPV
jgi:hypothetical protein